MSDYLTVVRAVYSGLSQREVAQTHQVSRNTVALLLRQAKSLGWLTLEDLNLADNASLSAALGKESSVSRDETFRMPDYEYVHTELAKPHVTLNLLWEEYVESCCQSGDRFYMETQFRRYYHKFARVHKATNRMEHKPALSLEVDWAGTKIAYFDAESGKMSEASLYVAVLPCSQLISSRRILAKLRNVQILSFEDLKNRIEIASEQINEAPLTGKSESRWMSYLAEEKDYVLPLPESPYEPAQWAKPKVQLNCHIAYAYKFYSVPFEYSGEEVDVRATQHTVEIFYHHQRIASHKRLWGKDNYATIQQHMPPDKLFFADWNRDRFLSWAEKVGKSTKLAVQAILDRSVILAAYFSPFHSTC